MHDERRRRPAQQTGERKIDMNSRSPSLPAQPFKGIIDDCALICRAAVGQDEMLSPMMPDVKTGWFSLTSSMEIHHG